MHLNRGQQLRLLILPSSETLHRQSTNISGSRKINRRNQLILLRLDGHPLHHAHRRSEREPTFTPLQAGSGAMPILRSPSSPNPQSAGRYPFASLLPPHSPNSEIHRGRSEGLHHQNRRTSHHLLTHSASHLGEDKLKTKEEPTHWGSKPGFLQQFQDVAEEFPQ